MPAAAPTRTRYRVTADQIEACNCPPNCGCQFTGYPNDGHCEAIIAFLVREGRFGETELAGVSFAVAMKYPGAIHEGGGTVALWVSDRATPAQRDAVVGILSGQHGGMPWEALAGTIAAFEGPLPAALEVHVAGNRSHFRIPGVLEVRQEPLRDVVSGQEKEVHVVYPRGGFFWNDGTACTTGTMAVRHGPLAFTHAGGWSATAEARWSND